MSCMDHIYRHPLVLTFLYSYPMSSFYNLYTYEKGDKKYHQYIEPVEGFEPPSNPYEGFAKPTQLYRHLIIFRKIIYSKSIQHQLIHY